MSNIDRRIWRTDQIWSADQLNATERRPFKILQDMFMYMLSDGIPATTGRVVGGLRCSAGTSPGHSAVGAGLAMRYNETDYAAPDSSFGLCYLEESDEVTHDAAHSTHPRIDLISITSAQAESVSEYVAQYDTVPSLQDLLIGSASTLLVTKGTAAASPAASSSPAGYVDLYEVLIPANDNDPANWTYTDVRTFWDAGHHVSSDVKTVKGNGSLGYTGGETYVDADGTEKGALRWNRTESLPAVIRTDVPAGDATGIFYPMLVPSDRLLKKTYPANGFRFNDLQNYLGVATGTFSYLDGFLDLTFTASTATEEITMPIPVPARGLEFVSGKVRYSASGLTGGDAVSFYLSWYDVDGAGVNHIASCGLDGPGGPLKNMTVASTPVIAEGDYLYATIRITNASGVGAAISLYGIELTFKEGRA